MSTLMRQIVHQKRQRRVALAALPFPEKVRIVEQMRESTGLIKTMRDNGFGMQKSRRVPIPAEFDPAALLKR